MAGLCEGDNEPLGSLKANKAQEVWPDCQRRIHECHPGHPSNLDIHRIWAYNRPKRPKSALVKSINQSGTSKRTMLLVIPGNEALRLVRCAFWLVNTVANQELLAGPDRLDVVPHQFVPEEDGRASRRKLGS
ncbi:hypothetical protein ANN_04234 [Periplaneta americana]|uniref:Uncharacterized protein n=1 Tax=Periplaneta americana TaxID=6978 RepID=A0ABQ8T809_PERAM|nr:hypothetical protein ANN_04234 [Periplaneta americana]